MTYDSLISPPSSSISPAVSLAKTDSTISFYNEYLVADPSNERSLREEARVDGFSLPQPYLGYGGIDSHIWFPPEPEDKEDDIEGSVANCDDDDDDDDVYGDGMKWGKPSHLSRFGQEGSGSFRFREETRKALNEVMNGKFKALVEHLLKSMGISCSGNDGDNWVDIVTALSWEAASFLKPDAFEEKTMDPDGYVKVKCIATGTRSQSEVFKGLVFKKHAAHKHMPTKCKKPKLLLIKGALSVSSDGLSSFESMKQESDRVNHLIEMIEKLNPNVVLVEKTVSRDIQESIYSKGMTLVLEMKQHRLERVARCTTSPILSSDNLNDQKLRQCESFYFEKIVEEHADVSESGKKPKKTLMFLEGCPSRMGFTILLKGCHNDELKKVKCVVQFAVIMAYHLILESSFILNQRAMFSTTAPDGMTIFSNNDEETISSVSSQPLYTNLDDTHVPIVNESSPETSPINTVDIPISSHLDENGSDNLGLEGTSLSSYDAYDPIVLSGLSSLSASLQKVVGIPLFDTVGYNDVNTHNHSEANGKDLSSTETVDKADTEVKVGVEETNFENSEECIQRKDDIRAVLDSESILVLMSRRNVARGITSTYSVSLPPWKVEFSNSTEGDYLNEEVEDVLQEGNSLFTEVENSLNKMENESKKLSDVKEMLKQEQDQFQVDMKNLTTNSSSDVYVNKWLQKPLYLNHKRWELFLRSYVWDERLYSILSSDLGTIGPQITDESGTEQSSFEEKDNIDHEMEIEAVSDDHSYLKMNTAEETNSIPSEVITAEIDIESSNSVQENGVQENVDGGGDVLLDQNFVNDMNVSPLYVNTKAKRRLQRAVWNDTAFLYSINVMDYSLLVGVDVEQKELVCGIIDYVRQYTWDKQLENWVKSFVVPKNQLPTIISPKEYKKRFRKFIDTHLFAVPDDWCSQRSSNRCSLCGVGSHSKSQHHEEMSS
ncbi:hypothetical protein M8C21_007472 [Ambrosia artemisiifolia]|uniref:1-phosphatidylinositol-3-phosphate 5-kinase n=1 Tax=Ambrosia artemisiifolia TaxID=4212 RepID=A0AAD5BR21_AMBAR|nr:hypothetical protein M8C21_007472 [Ambrosia artemisiifolia]